MIELFFNIKRYRINKRWKKPAHIAAITSITPLGFKVIVGVMSAAVFFAAILIEGLMQ